MRQTCYIVQPSSCVIIVQPSSCVMRLRYRALLFFIWQPVSLYGFSPSVINVSTTYGKLHEIYLLLPQSSLKIQLQDGKFVLQVATLSYPLTVGTRLL